MKPYSASCDKNKLPILEVLNRYLVDSAAMAAERAPEKVLELGSGTGQHAVFFAEQLPHILWQPSDVAEHQVHIKQWLTSVDSTNCLPPLIIDLNNSQLPLAAADHVFTANTLHIIDWSLVTKLLDVVAILLQQGGYFFVYGPFNYDGQYTSASNKEFDKWLKQRDPGSGIRGFESVVSAANSEGRGLLLKEDIQMPANNRMLVFQKNG